MSDSPRIFVTYRREDSSAYAGRLHDVLAEELGEDEVFQDVAAIAPGEDFERAVEEALTLSDVAIVVIGPRWLAPGPEGTPRIQHADDYVRLEISLALAQGLRIIPVLVGGADLPSTEDLPEDLEPLTRRQAIRLSDETWREDVNRLLLVLRGDTSPTARRWRLWAGALAAVAVVGLVVITVISLLGGGDDSAVEPDSCDTPGEPEWTPLYGPEGSAVASIEVENGTLDFVVTDADYRSVPEGEYEVVIATVMTNNTPIPVSHGYWHYEVLEVDRFRFEGQSCFFALQGVVDAGQSSEAHVGFLTNRAPEDSLRLIVESDGSRAMVDIPISG